ncbi:DUF2326 domain-containing protein [Actinosynnema sp. NPDC004786]
MVVNATDNGREISATIPRGRSKGITNMQVYCFDVDLVTLWSRRQRLTLSWPVSTARLRSRWPARCS